MSLVSKLKSRKAGKETSTNRSSISAAYFLGLEGATGYSNCSNFSKYLESLRDSEADELEEFFEQVRANIRMSNSTVRKIDRAGRPYVYCTFILPNANAGYKVIAESGMYEFIKDYQNGRVAIDFDIEVLAELAFNSEA